MLKIPPRSFILSLSVFGLIFIDQVGNRLSSCLFFPVHPVEEYMAALEQALGTLAEFTHSNDAQMGVGELRLDEKGEFVLTFCFICEQALVHAAFSFIPGRVHPDAPICSGTLSSVYNGEAFNSSAMGRANFRDIARSWCASRAAHFPR